MSTKLHDVADQAILKTALVPQNLTATATGSGQDFVAGDGLCFAIQMVGDISGTSPTLDGQIQESNDNTTWSDIDAGTFSTVSSSTNTQVLTFERTMRYLRYVGTVGGSSPHINAAVILGEQKKQL